MCCKKCSGMSGWILVVLGVLFLLKDVGAWNFWGLQWWTVGFLLLGVMMLGMSKCDQCNLEDGKKKKK